MVSPLLIRMPKKNRNGNTSPVGVLEVASLFEAGGALSTEISRIHDTLVVDHNP